MTLEEKWKAYNAAWDEFCIFNAQLRQHIKRLNHLLGIKLRQSIILAAVRKLNLRGPWPQTARWGKTDKPETRMTFTSEDDIYAWLKKMNDGMDLHDRKIWAQRARIKQAQRETDRILARINELEATIDHQTGRPPLAPQPITKTPTMPPTPTIGIIR